jgi:PBP1b-binding outer membrane lipoprotein LpoB
MKKVLFILIAVIAVIFVMTSCSGPSEAADAQQANTDSVTMFVESKWRAAPQKSRDAACDMIEARGIDSVLTVLALDAGDMSTEFRNAMRDILEREC